MMQRHDSAACRGARSCCVLARAGKRLCAVEWHALLRLVTHSNGRSSVATHYIRHTPLQSDYFDAPARISNLLVNSTATRVSSFGSESTHWQSVDGR